MKKIPVELTVHDYRNLKELIINQAQIIEKSTLLLSGTKMIRYEYIVISFLYERYLFLPNTETIEIKCQTNFNFYVFQAAALFYFLQDIENLPEGLQKVKNDLAQRLLKYMPDRKKSEFQKYYETELMKQYGLSYTELRDQLPEVHNSLEKMFKSLCLA